MNLSGSPLDFFLVFFGGVLVSFTPCVYPLLPITIAYIGASSANSRIKGFTLSLIYVTGISITYAILGLAAVLTGSLFGRFTSLPLVRIIAGAIIVLFGIVLWFGWSFRIPLLKLPAPKKSGVFLSCFILGLTSGLIISPCTAPVLGSILVFVAAKKNFVYGAFLLLSFAYGMGLLLIIAGTFSSILVSIPKSGYWMKIIQKIYAVILAAVGIYFVFSGIINAAALEFSANLPAGRLSLTGIAYAQDNGSSIAGVDFSLFDLEGNKVSLSEFKNKKSVVLLFWTTWCPYCIRGLNSMNRIHSDFIKEDIEVLAIDVAESRLRVERFLKRIPFDFKVLLDYDGSVSSSFGLIGVPTFVLINKSGEVVFKDNYFPQDSYKSLLAGCPFAE
ncbi:MAG: cytochrome c biogenesis protein CcdA [Candidatus Omnitrophota bacterium]